MGNLNKIDYSYFINQAVINVNTEEKVPLGIIFQKGSLIVECPWRIRKGDEILLGETDCISAPKQFSYNKVKELLLSKKIVNISYYRELLFVMEFEDNLSLELFHASSYFEGWALRGDDGFDVFTLPGGEVCY